MVWKHILGYALVAMGVANAAPAGAAELGVHLDSYAAEETPVDVAGAFRIIKEMGGTVVRRNTYWDAYQVAGASGILAFDASSVDFSESDYARYLEARGYGPSGENLRGPFQDIDAALQLELKELFNLNVIPAWAKRYPDAQFPETRAYYLANNAAMGEFLFDFIVYCSRQPGGREVLTAVAGFEIFNEVDGWLLKYNPGYGPNAAHQLPLSEYFEILHHSKRLTQRAFDSINWQDGVERPSVIGPNLTADYQPALWDAYVKDFPSRGNDKKPVVPAIGLHPYGITLRPWLDPVKLDKGDPDAEISGAWDKVGDNLSYGRILQPTDDWSWWRALVSRNAGKNAAWRLYDYEARGIAAEEHFNRNAEQGVERTLAQFSQAGLPVPRVFFSEFGASPYRGTAEQGGLRGTLFADPYRYGYFGEGEKLPEAVADNLALESLVQNLGLFESWDFVEVATVYDLFDGGAEGYLEQYGIVRSRLRKERAELLPQGLLLQAYMRGVAVNERNLSEDNGVSGVDLFVDKVGGSGAFKPKGHRADAHETVLLRDGDDSFNAAGGDDVVFAGAGNDQVDGGGGFDKLYGGAGKDVLNGGPGDDRLKGDAGDDVLQGGAGADSFVFAAYSTSGSGFAGHDVIDDFDPAEDRIVLVGGYAAQALLQIPGLLQQQQDGTRIRYADNGASIFFKGIKAAALSAEMFDVLTADASVTK
jgi:RTX calcium-binding nonapeptide repeat (4 copies)